MNPTWILMRHGVTSWWARKTREARVPKFLIINIWISGEIFLNGINKMDLNVLIPVLLFILLSPGVLLSLPPGSGHLVQVLTHAAVFGVVYSVLRMVFPQYY
jgi:hypothetical protein